MFIWTALVLGLMSSMHCAGMCGPIALALPSSSSVSRFKYVLGRLMYNLGRVLSYSFLGLLVGVLGKGIHLAGYQQLISISIGVLLLLMALFSINPEQITAKFTWVRNFYSFISRKMSPLLRSRNVFSLGLIGVLNGFLPCGMVYVALLAALAVGEVLDSVLYMAMFGLGTIPMMFMLSLVGVFLQQKYRLWLQRLTPFVIGIFAILLILRGLNLGIPFLSPVLEDTVEVKQSCH